MSPHQELVAHSYIRMAKEEFMMPNHCRGVFRNGWTKRQEFNCGNLRGFITSLFGFSYVVLFVIDLKEMILAPYFLI